MRGVSKRKRRYRRGRLVTEMFAALAAKKKLAKAREGLRKLLKQMED